MGAVFLAILELNCLPFDSSARDRHHHTTPPTPSSPAHVAQAWFELIKNDISLEDLMGQSVPSFLSLSDALFSALSCRRVQSDDRGVRRVVRS
jgi:hypothetical protein